MASVVAVAKSVRCTKLGTCNQTHMWIWSSTWKLHRVVTPRGLFIATFAIRRNKGWTVFSWHQMTVCMEPFIKWAKAGRWWTYMFIWPPAKSWRGRHTEIVFRLNGWCCSSARIDWCRQCKGYGKYLCASYISMVLCFAINNHRKRDKPCS